MSFQGFFMQISAHTHPTYFFMIRSRYPKDKYMHIYTRQAYNTCTGYIIGSNSTRYKVSLMLNMLTTEPKNSITGPTIT